MEEKINTRQKFIAAMKGGRKDFSNVIFLESIDLSGLNLNGFNLSGVSLQKANLTHTSLSNANLSRALMTNPRFCCLTRYRSGLRRSSSRRCTTCWARLSERCDHRLGGTRSHRPPRRRPGSYACSKDASFSRARPPRLDARANHGGLFRAAPTEARVTSRVANQILQGSFSADTTR